MDGLQRGRGGGDRRRLNGLRLDRCRRRRGGGALGRSRRLGFSGLLRQLQSDEEGHTHNHMKVSTCKSETDRQGKVNSTARHSTQHKVIHTSTVVTCG